jgi:pilus assembly protein Flp/PilA
MRKKLHMLKPSTTKGAALVEYGILVGLIAVLAIVAVLTLGSTVRDTFNQVSDTLSTSLASASAGFTVGSGVSGTSAPVVAAADCTALSRSDTPAPGDPLCGGYYIQDWSNGAWILSDALSVGNVDWATSLGLINAYENEGVDSWGSPASNPLTTLRTLDPSTPARIALDDPDYWLSSGNSTVAWQIDMATGNIATFAKTSATAVSVGLVLIPYID